MTNDERDVLLLELKLKLETLQEEVGKISHVLIEGNGKPALTEQVLTNRLKIERLEEEREDKKLPRSASIGIIVSIVFGLTGFLTSVL